MRCSKRRLYIDCSHDGKPWWWTPHIRSSKLPNAASLLASNAEIMSYQGMWRAIWHFMYLAMRWDRYWLLNMIWSLCRYMSYGYADDPKEIHIIEGFCSTALIFLFIKVYVVTSRYLTAFLFIMRYLSWGFEILEFLLYCLYSFWASSRPLLLFYNHLLFSV